MRIFVTGGTGFVGSEVVRQLAVAGHELVALVRPGSEGKLVKVANVSSHLGDVTEPDCLPGGMAGCDAVIHLVGVIREFPERGVTYERLHVKATENVIAAAASQGVRRYLHMSANGVRENSAADYHRTKWRAEEAVRASDLDWTIFRPSLLFGRGGEFVAMLAGMVRRLPVVPVIGDGRYRLQPVAVEQVAETFVKALDMPETAGRVFHLGGAESYPFDEILDLVGRALGKARVLKIHQPAPLVRPIVVLMERCRSFPVTLDQMTMMLEGNVCDQGPWAEAFGIEPVSFAEGIAGCLDPVRTKT
jgi:NADH dehydrogenase